MKTPPKSWEVLAEVIFGAGVGVAEIRANQLSLPPVWLSLTTVAGSSLASSYSAS